MDGSRMTRVREWMKYSFFHTCRLPLINVQLGIRAQIINVFDVGTFLINLVTQTYLTGLHSSCSDSHPSLSDASTCVAVQCSVL